ncbi:MAG TPA: DEAD/DEAH box helicase, partial [Desulfobacterales bacterium]|nr:DEAD/DEAH box helicase [Desulfobacterales bacterium]
MSDEPENLVEIPRAGKPEFLTTTRFEYFNLPSEVHLGLADAGFEFCTPIQAEALPVLLQGRDVAGQAHTGTGKTAAFLVTVIGRLLAMPDRKTGLPQAIIMAPTRELSRQIFEEAQVLSRHTDITLLEVVGGIDYKEQAEGLTKGTDIVIGTPGRIIDYYKQGILKTQDIKFLVIDEADRLLDLGFEKDMRYILRKLPHYEKRQSMLFSATLSHRVLELTYEFMNLPEFISVIPDKVTVEGIEQSLFHVGTDRKFQLLLGLLQREDFARMLIFVNMKIDVERLARRLKANGWPAEGITGDLPQRQRFKLMERFKSGQIRILLATDVASRGIHVEDISHVINYDLPQDAENYVHRIGRTARAGKDGKAISLACEEYVLHLEPIEEILGYKLPVVWPEEEWFIEDRSRPEDRERRRFGHSGERRGDRRGERRGERRGDRPGERRDRDRGRGPRPERGGERRSERAPEAPAKTAKTRRRFPGAFFGFGPEVPEEAEAPAVETAPVAIAAVEAPAVEAPAVESAPPDAAQTAVAAEEAQPADRPKKRRRRRRRKRSPAEAAAASGGASESEPADEVA